MEPIFEFGNSHTHILCWFFCPCDVARREPGRQVASDVFGVIWRNDERGGWRMRVRLRLSDSDNPNDPNDEMRVGDAHYATEEGAVRAARLLVRDMGQAHRRYCRYWGVPPQRPTFCYVRGDSAALYESMKGQPYVHVSSAALTAVGRRAKAREVSIL